MTIDPVVKILTVGLDPKAAFDLFTTRIGDWWPSETFSVSAGQDKPARSVKMEGRVGGEIVEIAADGSRHVWGTLTQWTHGEVFATTWHPGRSPDIATQVNVTFEADGAGTRLTLTHSNWEALGEEAVQTREGYDGGWVKVLARYEAAE